MLEPGGIAFRDVGWDGKRREGSDGRRQDSVEGTGFERVAFGVDFEVSAGVGGGGVGGIDVNDAVGEAAGFGADAEEDVAEVVVGEGLEDAEALADGGFAGAGGRFSGGWKASWRV